MPLTKEQLKPNKDFVEITLIKLIKKHDLNFIPKRIEAKKDRIILWGK